MPTYLVLNKTFRRLRHRKKTLYTLIFAFYCSFNKHFFQKLNKNNFNPRYSNFYFLLHCKKHIFQKSLKLLKRLLRSRFRAFRARKPCKYNFFWLPKIISATNPFPGPFVSCFMGHQQLMFCCIFKKWFLERWGLFCFMTLHFFREKVCKISINFGKILKSHCFSLQNGPKLIEFKEFWSSTL